MPVNGYLYDKQNKNKRFILFDINFYFFRDFSLIQNKKVSKNFNKFDFHFERRYPRWIHSYVIRKLFILLGI